MILLQVDFMQASAPRWSEVEWKKKWEWIMRGETDMIGKRAWDFALVDSNNSAVDAFYEPFTYESKPTPKPLNTRPRTIIVQNQHRLQWKSL